MERLRHLGLLDENGQLFEDRIQQIFERLVRKFRRHFPGVQDEVDFMKIFEKSACKLLEHERESGPLERPHGYAWATIRSVAISEARGASIEGHRVRAESKSARNLIASLHSPDGTPEQMHREVLISEFGDRLNPEERVVFARSMYGYSNRQIATALGRSPAAIDNMLSRIRKKLRAFVQEQGTLKKPMAK